MNDIAPNIVDLRNMEWTLSKDTPGSPGMFLKGRKDISGKACYMKLGSYNSVDGFYGIEPVLELLTSRLADVLEYTHIPYKLIKGRVLIDGIEYITPVSGSIEYRKPGERRLSIGTFVDMNKQSHRPIEFLLETEWKMQIVQMMLFDYLIYNRDRHEANIEVLTNGLDYRLVPMFDHGCCLTQPLFDKWKDTDNSYFLADSAVNNYLGSKSLLRNLQTFCKTQITLQPRKLPNSLISGFDDFIDPNYSQLLLNMLQERYNNAVDILCK